MSRHDRSAASLVEVIVAGGVLAVMLLPIFLTWMSARSGAGQDSREVQATHLAAEILEQVMGVKRHNGSLKELHGPSETVGVDLETLRAEEPAVPGITLYPTRCCGRTSRIYLSDLPAGFKRTLLIRPELAGGDNGFFGPQVLWRVTARVVFATPRTAGAVEKDVTLTTCIFDEKRSKAG